MAFSKRKGFRFSILVQIGLFLGGQCSIYFLIYFIFSGGTRKVIIIVNIDLRVELPQKTEAF